MRNDTRAASPAISTVIITSALVVLVLVTVVYANNFLDVRMAENEFSTNKQFMLTTGLQIDDIAWTIGRTQTIRYSSSYGHIAFKNAILTYSCQVSADGVHWEDIFTYSTGAVMFNIPVTQYSLGNNYFERVGSQNNKVCQEGPSAPVAQVYVIEKMPMDDGSYIRTVAVPSIRMLHSAIESQGQIQEYAKFYLPLLSNGTNPMLSQSITLTGKNVVHYIRSDVQYVRFEISFPNADQGFDSDFFNFDSTSMTIPLNPNSVVEFYIGDVTVSLGLHA